MDLATPRQPERRVVVTYVLGTFCYPCLRAGQAPIGGRSRIRTADPLGVNDARLGPGIENAALSLHPDAPCSILVRAYRGRFMGVTVRPNACAASVTSSKLPGR